MTNSAKNVRTIELIDAHREVLEALQEAAEHHHVQDNNFAFELTMHQRAVFGQQALVNVRNDMTAPGRITSKRWTSTPEQSPTQPESTPKTCASTPPRSAPASPPT